MRILITGGTGTFGKAFIRRVLTDPVETARYTGVVSYARDEVKAAQITGEFGWAAPFKAFIGDVRDSQRLGMALRGVHTVVHAAALKRVDVGAYSPSELIATNILGTMNVVNAAIQAGVARVVVISSDKAVNAINIYGATKYCAETYAVQANAYGFPSGTRIAAVRYGNILGSRGSVFHTWRDQARVREQLQITNVAMTRFIMTIEQAVDLVLLALGSMQGGEVFVPKLPSATMVDLMLAIALDAGIATQANNNWWEQSALRPGGEKLAESLLNEEEPSRTFDLGRYCLVTPTHHEWRTDGWPGQVVPPHFTLRSDSLAPRLGVAELRSLIATTEACR